MISRDQIDITSLRTFFINGYDKAYNDTYLIKKYARYGLYTGLMKTGNIDVLSAGVSHVQYKIKTSGKAFISWWQVQHILIAYIKTCIVRREILSNANINSFVIDISNIKTDQGTTAFKQGDIITVLNILLSNYTDPNFTAIFKSPLVVSQTPEAPAIIRREEITPPVIINREEGKPVIIPALIDDKKSVNLMAIGGGVLALVGLMFIKNKKGKKKRR